MRIFEGEDLDLEMSKKAISTTTLCKLVNLIVDCMDTVRAKKNWNSHGSTLGATICQLSSIISGLRKTSEEEPKDTATDANKGFLVLHCLDQLVTQDVAMCMLTTSVLFFQISKK